MVHHNPKLSDKLLLAINHQTNVFLHVLKSKVKIVCGMLCLKIKHLRLKHALKLNKLVIPSNWNVGGS